MSWNGSQNASKSASHRPDADATARPHHRSHVRALLAVLVVLGAGALIWLNQTDSGAKNRPASGAPAAPTGEDVAKPRKVISQTNANAVVTTSQRAAQIAREYNEQVKNLIKAKTNNIVWIEKPLDPNDPDHALRTRVMQELGSLLSVEPGEAMPPFPYSFLAEDDQRAAAERGEGPAEIDNGNAAFLEGLKKFKIVAKETDDVHRLEHKEKLLQAQGELLEGMDQGLSVNDSIRAAYEFRKRAFETRQAAIQTMSEFLQNGDSAEDTKGVLKQINQQFAEQGIKAISEAEIGIEAEEEENVGDNQP